ncbi:MAG: succinate dehydrogenase, hydrophobic membrane anchor protein [Mariprofundaceae bacterium]
MVSRRKDIGTAHNGLDDWYWQRLSAVVLMFLLPWPFLLLCGVYSGDLNQFQLLDYLDHFVSRLMHTVLIVALIVHGYMGLKVMIEDYVHVTAWRVPLIGVMIVTMASVGLWWLAIIWAWGG